MLIMLITVSLTADCRLSGLQGNESQACSAIYKSFGESALLGLKSKSTQESKLSEVMPVHELTLCLSCCS